MGRVFEIILANRQPALRDGSARGAGNHNPVAPPTDKSLVAAITALPQVTSASGFETQVTTLFDNHGALAKTGLQVQLSTTTDNSERHIEVLRCTRYSPGVLLRESLYEATLDSDAPVGASLNAAPEALKQTLSSAGDLLPVLTRSHEREHWQCATPECIAVELTLDRFSISARNEGSLQSELRLTTSYVEDTVQASVAALFATARELVARLPAFPVLRSATDVTPDENSTSEPARAAPIDVSNLSAPHAAFIVIGGNLADHWFGNDAGVRDAVSTEFVHQMRVAQRRLKTALRIFPHWMDDAWKARVAPDLKWLGAVLGEARDWDVFVDSTLPVLVAADTETARWSATRDAAEALRLKARERARAAVGSARYAQLALAWLEWLSALPSRDPPANAAESSLRAYARKHVRKYYERIVGAPKLTTLDDQARHQERIQAKYLRYTLEFFESILSPKTRADSAKTVSRIQSVLGDGNDAAVALRFLEQMDVEPYQLGFARGWCQAVKRYTAHDGECLLRTLHVPKVTGGEAD